MSVTRCRPPLTNWYLTFWNIFFSLKLPLFSLNKTKLRLVCLQNRSVLPDFGLMIFIAIIDYRLLFCWNVYSVSDRTSKIRQGWETHPKGLSRILPTDLGEFSPFKVSNISWDFCIREITFLTHLMNLLET